LLYTPRPRAPRSVAALRARRFVVVVGLSSLTLSAASLLSSRPAQAQSARAAMVRVETARLRKGPGDDHKPTGLLDAGRKAKVIARNGEWAKVRLESGTEGWVRRDLLSVSRKRVSVSDSDNNAAAERRAAKRAHLKRLAAAEESASDKKAAKRAHLKRLAAINAKAAQAKRHKAAIAAAQNAQAKRNKIVAAKQAAQNKAARIANAQAEARAHTERLALQAKRAEIAKQVAKARAEQVAINEAARKARAVALQQENARAHAEKVARNNAAREAARLARVAQNDASDGITGAASRVGEKSAAAASRAASLASQSRESEAVGELETIRPLYSPAAPSPAPVVVTAAPSPSPQVARTVRASISAPRTVILPSSQNGKTNVSIPPATRDGGSVNRTSSRGDSLIRTALSFRGTPYRMGATGRGAFDCSGFIRYIYAQQGSALPRTAAEQYGRGFKVDKADLQAGDLVFFKNTYKRGVSHVGMYIGNGQFVHASSGRHAVTVSNLSDSYYQNHWAGARRPR